MIRGWERGNCKGAQNGRIPGESMPLGAEWRKCSKRKKRDFPGGPVVKDPWN